MEEIAPQMEMFPEEKEEILYKATLNISSVPGSDRVTIELKYSHDREELGENQPVSYSVMDFISNYAILPYVGIAEEMLLTQEGSDAVN